jgi:hypothetical protein
VIERAESSRRKGVGCNLWDDLMGCKILHYFISGGLHIRDFGVKEGVLSVADINPSATGRVTSSVAHRPKGLQSQGAAVCGAGD